MSARTLNFLAVICIEFRPPQPGGKRFLGVLLLMLLNAAHNELELEA
jgi:hypothetical protein